MISLDSGFPFKQEKATFMIDYELRLSIQHFIKWDWKMKLKLQKEHLISWMLSLYHFQY